MLSLLTIAALSITGVSPVAKLPAPASLPRGYSFEAKVCQGDPLGSVMDGDVKVLGSLSGGTVPRSKNGFNIYQSGVREVEGGQVVAGYFMWTDFEPAEDGKVRLRLTLQHSEVEEDDPQETVARTSYKRHDRVINDGETVRLRWGKSADRDTWLELTVRVEK
jgi:hypothetical protein